MKIRKIRNKKGDILTPETVKIVIAALCLVGLFILAFKLYSLFTAKTAIEQARETLNQLTTTINSMKEGGETKFMITSPKDWYLLLFISGQNMPISCGNAKSCLCICGYQGSEGCDKTGICKTLDSEIIMNYICDDQSIFVFTNVYKCFKIKIANLPIRKTGGKVFIGSDQDTTIGLKLKQSLDYVDPDTGKSIRQIFFDYVASGNDNTRIKIVQLIKSYVKENVPEVYAWSLNVYDQGKKIGSVEFYPISAGGGEMPEINAYKHNFEERQSYNNKEYLFQWEFNLDVGN